MKTPSVIIIGAGAAGIAAASRLVQSGITSLTILEAENRIGGRINSVDFAGSVFDLGGQWCHGEDDNVVHSLVKNLNLLGSSYNAYDDFTFYESTGKLLDKDLTDRMVRVAWKINYDEEALSKAPGSFGEYFIERYKNLIEEEFNKQEELEIASKLLAWFHKLLLCLDAAPTWFDMSATGTLHYKECDGDYYLHWKGKGYKTVLDVLMEKFPSESPAKIYLNKQVSKISYDSRVTLECSDGSVFKADHVIVTVSLGVLKENYKKLFSPELPLGKQKAIEGLGFGAVDKMVVEFEVPWWPSDIKGFNFVWTEQDRLELVGRFPEAVLNGRSWLENIFGFHTVDSHPNVLLGWVLGPQVELVEKLSDGKLLEGSMYLLRKFLGHLYKIPFPKDFIRSTWKTNPHFCGSYSYRSIASDKLNVYARDLAEPVRVNDKNVLLFSGEATHSYYYSTVHGAIESGYREADRIIATYTRQKHSIIIIGAGMAGLGAARALLQAKFDDFVVLEAQNEPGGRIKTVFLDNGGFLDLGAQWIHGRSNLLYRIALENDLVSSVTSEEGRGVFIRDDGRVYDDFLVKEVNFKVGKILRQCEDFTDATAYPKSVGDFLEKKFYEYLQAENNLEDVNMKLELFDWHVKFQLIDNSCRSLKNLSAKEWGRYSCDDSRQAHINLKCGYKSLIDVLIQDVNIKYNSPVLHISRQNGVQCFTSEGIITCDHVIVTTSLPIIKNLFEPELPVPLCNAVTHMGFYGGIGKIFLIFGYKWWNVEGFQLVWRLDTVSPIEESWTRNISGFDVVFNQPNVLLGWVGAESVEMMEKLPDCIVGIHCVNLLRKFLKTESIPYPEKVIKSKWSTCEWVQGGYSHSTPACDEANVGPTSLCRPVFENNIPRIWLAGEACHSSHFSTTHGAFESGQSQAKHLLKFLK